MGYNQKKEFVKVKYSKYFGLTSKETIKANVREDIVVKNQKNRFLTKLPQDLMKLDIMAANHDLLNDKIKITFVQQKGNNSSFNSTSESKTIETMVNCLRDKTYVKYFNLLPEHLNPILTGKNYDVDFCVGMVNAIGERVNNRYGDVITYLSNDDYLKYIGLEIDIVELSYQISKQDKILNHSYDAVDLCSNFDYIYDKCYCKIYGGN